MLTLNVESIKDYQVCELFYDYRYQQREPESYQGRELMVMRFENTLKRVASFFFYKKQGDATPSYNALLNRWEKLWFPKSTDAYDIALEQHESAHGNLASFTTAAAASLMQFHEDFVDDKREPILIDEKFLIPVDKDIRIEGKIDLMLRDNMGKHYVLKWSGRQKRPAITSMALDFAAQKMAVDYRNTGRRVQVAYGLYDLASTKPGFVNAYPSKTDVDMLSFWARDIRDTKTFVPRRGYTVYCRGCAFDVPCSKWNDWSNHSE